MSSILNSCYQPMSLIHFHISGVNFAIQKGLEASRSRIEWFEHNSVEHLEQLLLEQAERDREVCYRHFQKKLTTFFFEI